jgi:hypothetical protein
LFVQIAIKVLSHLLNQICSLILCGHNKALLSFPSVTGAQR